MKLALRNIQSQLFPGKIAYTDGIISLSFADTMAIASSLLQAIKNVAKQRLNNFVSFDFFLQKKCEKRINR